MADRDGHAVVPAASGNDPELDSIIERWPDVGRMAAGRRTPRGAALAPLEDSSAPSNTPTEHCVCATCKSRKLARRVACAGPGRLL